MATARDIKRRISSVKNIGQVTRALEAVSASKARRAQKQAALSRPYTQSAWEVLVNLAGQGLSEHPLMRVPETVENIDIVLITSDRGLAGVYNQNIIRAAEQFVGKMNANVRWITVGRKGRDYFLRRSANIIAEFSDLGQGADLSFTKVTPIADIIVGDFLDGKADQVFLAYTDFINVLTQKPVVANLLPLQPYGGNMVASDYFKEEPEQTVTGREYIYEPNATAILDYVVPRFTALQVYQAILEAEASEHAARMVAMRNASDNADSLVEDLTLEYNKARQSSITAEILDIVGGVEALDSGKSGDKEKVNHFESAAVQQAEEFIQQVGGELKAEKTNREAAQDSGKPDDLKVIEGVGPKVAKALNDAGITTFADVAKLSADDLVRIVKVEGGVRIVGDASTWAKQAQYLVDGDMDGLETYQDRLVGGREPEN